MLGKWSKHRSLKQPFRLQKHQVPNDAKDLSRLKEEGLKYISTVYHFNNMQKLFSQKQTHRGKKFGYIIHLNFYRAVEKKDNFSKYLRPNFWFLISVKVWYFRLHFQSWKLNNFLYTKNATIEGVILVLYSSSETGEGKRRTFIKTRILFDFSKHKKYLIKIQQKNQLQQQVSYFCFRRFFIQNGCMCGFYFLYALCWQII